MKVQAVLSRSRLLPATCLIAVVALLAAPAAAIGQQSSAGRPASLVVATRDGLLQGKRAEGADQFLGIPYAAPPVGPLRWRAPEPVAPWAGVRPVTAYGNRCPQLRSQDGQEEDDENCLFLNVFTPSGDRRAPGTGGLPVLFWIHGGMLLHGAGDLYDGSLIARRDHVIVVSINYRLGVFGFLDVPGLGTSAQTASGNYGLLDQEAALRWVHANIAGFGGNPDRITIGGESAGGWSVCALLTAPAVRGLFIGAIMESGSCASRTQAQAQAVGQQLATNVGCTDPATALACLRGKPESVLLDATASAATAIPSAHVVEFTSGGPDLPAPPARAVADGDYAHVPLLIGTNHDEARYFTQIFAADDQRAFDGLIAAQYGSAAPAILQQYPWTSFPSPYAAAYALASVDTDSGYFYGIGGCPAQDLAAQFASTTRTFFYQFDDESAPAQNDMLPGFQWGAAHTQELGFLFPGYNPYGTDLYQLLTPAELQLSRQMIAWWGAFLWRGAPVAPGEPDWPGYASGELMSLRPGGQSKPITAAAFAGQHQCAFWAGVLAAGGPAPPPAAMTRADR